MARGHQKLQSQAKTQEKTAKLKKQQGHSATEQKKAAQKALVISCTICKVNIFITLDTIEFFLRKQISLFIHPGANARSEDIQTTFREQASQERSTGRVERSCLTQHRIEHLQI